MDEKISNFVAISGASPEVARSFLEMANGDLEQAMQLFFENPDLATGVGAGLSNTASSHPPDPAPRSNIGRQDAEGIIHIDSDDDDMQIDEDSDPEIESDRAAAVQAAALAQEEEDAAMAKRLQEELYSDNQGSGAGADDVRAPIARTTETLVAPGPAWGGNDDNIEQAMLEHLRQRRRQHPGGKFGNIQELERILIGTN